MPRTQDIKHVPKCRYLQSFLGAVKEHQIKHLSEDILLERSQKAQKFSKNQPMVWKLDVPCRD